MDIEAVKNIKKKEYVFIYKCNYKSTHQSVGPAR